jgi:chemotaxis protein methyltransferase CheR
LVSKHDLRNLSALIATLREAGAERLRVAVVEAMTTNETSWFRDGEPFEVFSSKVIPELVAARRERKLSIWSAACSTGQEPYTIAMSMLDHPALTGWKLEVLATDLSEEVLTKARKGRYSQLEMNRGMPAACLAKHFERVGTAWQVRQKVRSMVSFRQLNLGQDFPPMPSVDVVFLRNVLIYFDSETKQKVLNRVTEVIRPGGYLFLGASESTLGLEESFERIQHGSVLVYRTLKDSESAHLGSRAIRR